MPKKYEEIRDKLESEGYSKEEAEGIAARIYNAQRKEDQKPVTRNFDKKSEIMFLGRKCDVLEDL